MDRGPISNAIGKSASTGGALKASWIREGADLEARPLSEAVTRVGTANYRRWTANLRKETNEMFLAQVPQAFTDVATWRTRIESELRVSWRDAWQDGIKEFGLTLADLTAPELLTLNSAIARDTAAVSGYVDFVLANRGETVLRNPHPGLPGHIPHAAWRKQVLASSRYSKVNARQRIWWNSYHRVANEAKQLAAGNRPLAWVLGPTEEHCNDCFNYNGRVYRASTWARWDIRPQHPALSCHGFNCLCRFQATTEPVTRGRPPAMTG